MIRRIPTSVWAIVALAAAVRLAFVLAYPQYPALLGDDDMYDEVAWHLASGDGFVGGVGGIAAPGRSPGPEIAIGPAYPAFLAAVYRVAGHNLQAARVAQALLGSVTVLLCYLLGRDAVHHAAGRTAAVLATVSPALVSYTGMLLSETLFTFLLVLMVWLVLCAMHSDTPIQWVLAGVVAGLATLAREEALLAVPLFAIVAWSARPRAVVRTVGPFVAACLLIVGIWTVRNYAVFGRFVLVSANAGQTVWISTKGWTEWHKAESPEYQAIAGGLSYVDASRVLFRAGVANIAADPIGYLRICAGRIGPLWIGSHTTYVSGLSRSFAEYRTRGELGRVVAKAAFLLFHLAVLGLAVCGAIGWLKTRDRRLQAAVVLTPVAVVATVHFFLFATSRYLVPIMPFLFICAATALSPAASRRRFEVVTS